MSTQQTTKQGGTPAVVLQRLVSTFTANNASGPARGLSISTKAGELRIGVFCGRIPTLVCVRSPEWLKLHLRVWRVGIDFRANK